MTFPSFQEISQNQKTLMTAWRAGVKTKGELIECGLTGSLSASQKDIDIPTLRRLWPNREDSWGMGDKLPLSEERGRQGCSDMTGAEKKHGSEGNIWGESHSHGQGASINEWVIRQCRDIGECLAHLRGPPALLLLTGFV